MNTIFIVSGILGLVVLTAMTFSILSQHGVDDIQPSIKSIILFWREEIGIKKTIAFFDFFFLYIIAVGIICSFVGIDFLDFDIIGFVFGFVVYLAPIFIYSKITGLGKK